MVNDVVLAAGRRLLDSVRHDLSAFRSLSNDPWSPQNGLHTYRIAQDGSDRRLHLRIEGDGRGVLFVDVTDVIHLNATAAVMAKMALDGLPIAGARRLLLPSVAPSQRAEMRRDLDDMYGMIWQLSHPSGDCPTCEVAGLDNAPLFSVPARAPYKADLALTYGCNNACGHCYNETDRFAMPSLHREEWFRVLDKLCDLGVPHVIFTGGEATLHPDLPELIRYADSLGLVTGVNSNGRRMANRRYLESLAAAGLNHVQITLGSSRPGVHDAMIGARSFEQTVRGIKNALSSRVHCITNTTLMRCNRDHVSEIIVFLHDLGIRTFAMNGMIYSGGGRSDPNAIPEAEMAPILIRIRDRAAELGMRFLWYTPTEYCRMSPVELEIGAKRCNAAEYSICIEPNGDVLPCQSYYVSAGNMLVDPWQTIWQGRLFRSFRDRNEDPRSAGLPEKCWDCPDLPLCGGGCRLEREAHNGQNERSEVGTVGTGTVSCSGSCSGGRENLNSNTRSGFVPSPGAAAGEHRSQGHSLDLMKALAPESIEIITTSQSEDLL